MTDGSERHAGRHGAPSKNGDDSPNCELVAAKSRMRRQMRVCNAAVAPAVRHADSERLAQTLLASALWHACDAVLAFSAVEGEPEIGTVLAAALSQGRLVGLPSVTAGGIVFHQLLQLDQLRPGYRGILEPSADTRPLTAAAWGQALLLVPGMAFDAAGGRLGRGGGHYDRFIAAGRRLRRRWRVVGICFDDQLVHEVPRNEADECVDEVLTERGWLAGGRGWEYHGRNR